MSLNSQIDIQKIVAIARRAGEAILDIYDSDDFGVEYKQDNSPVTKADLASNKIIIDELGKLYPDIPIVSEEHPKADNYKAMESEFVWVVDPLDGTKDFVARKDSFTVMVGLLHNKKPVMGVVYAPKFNEMYWGSIDDKAYLNGKPIHVSDNTKVKTVVASRSHYDKLTKEFLEQFNDIKLVRAGSSLKMCLVAAGKAEMYPRFHPCMEWDTAASEAILLAAGGAVVNLNGEPLKYGKPGLLNPSFIAHNNHVKWTT